ncbi:hypothetical protein IFM89_009411, partial [Coptis chinensis]
PDQPALPPPPLFRLSGSSSRVRPGIENNGPSTSQGPSTAESTNFWKTKKFLWAAIVAAFVLISFGILFFMLKCCKGKQRGDKFSKSHKMGASNARMGKFDDIESMTILIMLQRKWVNHDGDMYIRRYSEREVKISPYTVSKLKLKWEFVVGKDITATPGNT